MIAQLLQSRVVAPVEEEEEAVVVAVVLPRAAAVEWEALLLLLQLPQLPNGLPTVCNKVLA